MDNSRTQKTMNADSVFSNRFLNSKSLYLYNLMPYPAYILLEALMEKKHTKHLKKIFHH